MRRRWRTFGIGCVLLIGGAWLAHSVQTSGGTVVEDVRFDAGDGRQMAALLYRPANATAGARAPGVLAVHGYINSRETQSAFSIEFARRGYVVLAIDQMGHGFSDGVAFSDGYGGPAALRYLRSLPFVDSNNIALTGHSMGGWTGLAAAAAFPDDYRSVVLVGSSTGPGYAPAGDTEFPRNLGVVFSQYDEFAGLMWGVERALDLPSGDKLKAVFGSTEDIVPGIIYGDVAAGTARWLAMPATTHPGDHLSPSAVADTLAWLRMTLTGGRTLEDGDQIWHWKETGTALALIGGLLLLLGSVELLLGRPAFADLVSAGNGRTDRAEAGWWTALIIASLVPAVSYYPFIRWAAVFEPNSLFPQGVTNRIVVWALANALIAGAISALGRRLAPAAVSVPRQPGNALPSLVLAVASVLLLYFAVAAIDWLFKVDLRFWVVALKPMAAHHVPTFLAYLLPFTAFFYVTQRCWFRDRSLRRGVVAQYASFVFASVGAFAVMIAGMYFYLFTFGRLPGVDALYTIVAIQFVPVLTATSVIAVFCWRKTDSVALGSMVCGLLVSWYVVAGQATHV